MPPSTHLDIEKPTRNTLFDTNNSAQTGVVVCANFLE